MVKSDIFGLSELLRTLHTIFLHYRQGSFMFAMQMPYRFLNLSTAFQSDEIDGVFKNRNL